MKILSGVEWVVFFLDPSDWDSAQLAMSEFGYHPLREGPVVVCMLGGSWLVELYGGGDVVYNGGVGDSSKDVKCVFDALLAKSGKCRGAVEAGLRKLEGGGVVVPDGRLSDVDEWSGGFEVLGRGVEGEVGVSRSHESFDVRLGVVLEVVGGVRLSDEDEWQQGDDEELGESSVFGDYVFTRWDRGGEFGWYCSSDKPGSELNLEFSHFEVVAAVRMGYAGVVDLFGDQLAGFLLSNTSLDYLPTWLSDNF